MKLSRCEEHIEFDIDTLRDLFYINQDSPTGLSYAGARYSGMGRLMAEKDAPAGGNKPNKSHGYYTVNMDGIPRLVHRIIYTLAYGAIPPGMFIDHVNGVRSDNRLENLRIVDRKTNQRNRKMSSSNTSGFVGVSRVNRERSPYYYAQWTNEDGKVVSKIFTINKYGEDLAFQLAVEFRMLKLAELNDKGANYSERHILGGE